MKIKITKTQWQKIGNFGGWIKKSSLVDNLYDVYREEIDNILQEYFSENRVAGSKMSWSVIPFNQIKRIWQDYALYGIVRNERGMDNIVEQIVKIFAKLCASTDLAGHGQFFDIEEYLEENGYPHINGDNWDFYESFLNTEYGSPVSDYGIKPIYSLIEKLENAKTAEEKLLIVDRILNVIHRRGDLSKLFIEGGVQSLDNLSER